MNEEQSRAAEGEPRAGSGTILRVGELLHPEILTYPEGVEYNYRSGQHLLIYFLSRPHAHEIVSIGEGVAEFAFGVFGDVIYLCHRFGVMSWWDATYSWHRVHPDDQVLPEEPGEAGLHALLTTVLVDAATGRVAALRACTFGARFTAELHQAIRRQAASFYDAASYEEQVRQLYRRFTIEELVERADDRCRGGD